MAKASQKQTHTAAQASTTKEANATIGADNVTPLKQRACPSQFNMGWDEQLDADLAYVMAQECVRKKTDMIAMLIQRRAMHFRRAAEERAALLKHSE